MGIPSVVVIVDPLPVSRWPPGLTPKTKQVSKCIKPLKCKIICFLNLLWLDVPHSQIVKVWPSEECCLLPWNESFLGIVH